MFWCARYDVVFEGLGECHFGIYIEKFHLEASG